MKKYIETDNAVKNLNFTTPWKSLSTKEKNYAYFMTKASYAGSKMVFH